MLLPAAWLAAPTAFAATASHSPAPTAASRPTADSGPAVRHDTSPTLRSMAAAAAGNSKTAKNDTRNDELVQHRPYGEEERHTAQPPTSRVPDPVPDPVVQTAPGAGPATSLGVTFDGTDDEGTRGAPPDPNASVGTTQIFEFVNSAVSVYSKTGATLLAPTNTETLWSGFGGDCETGSSGDGTVRWDGMANRWVISAIGNAPLGATTFTECVAVSTGQDATGTYNRYAFQYSVFPDYQKLSVWPDAYYVTFKTDTGPEVCALDRASMLAGGAATQQCRLTADPTFHVLLGADLDGTTPPPSGEPETLLSLGPTDSSLSYWKFHVDWTTPANSTFTGPTTLAVAPYTQACGNTSCVPQAGTTNELSTISDTLMYRLAYRNFGDHESMVVDHSVDADSSIGMRWYELRMSGGNPTLFQQGTFAPDSSSYRWMGSIAMDKVGNIGMGYSESSPFQHPSIRVTGRLASDAPGTMTQGEATIFTGGGSQIDTLDRWGDYTSMAVDPVDGCTFWYTNEYLPADGTFNWHTRIGSFTLPNC